jgi:hypothetical protein
MTQVTGQQNRSVSSPFQQDISHRHTAGIEVGIDLCTVKAIRQRLALFVGKTETPSSTVVAGDVWYSVGLIWQAVQACLQLLQGQLAIDRIRIIQNMQI